MDVLENYKKAWVNQPEETSRFSAIEIYKMAHSKSSSIVKWIFIIGILEFILVATVNVLFGITPEDNITFKNNPIINNLIWIELLSYIIIIYFLIQFYLNFKRISTVDDTKTLMNNILKTRKSVKLYVFINIAFAFIFSSIALFYNIFSESSGSKFFVLILISLALIVFFMFLYWLFYQLLYGFLLKKLNKNYKELAKLDASI